MTMGLLGVPLNCLYGFEAPCHSRYSNLECKTVIHLVKQFARLAGAGLVPALAGAESAPVWVPARGAPTAKVPLRFARMPSLL